MSDECAVGNIVKYNFLLYFYVKFLMLTLGKVEAEKYLIKSQFYGTLRVGEVK